MGEGGEIEEPVEVGSAPSVLDEEPGGVEVAGRTNLWDLEEPTDETAGEAGVGEAGAGEAGVGEAGANKGAWAAQCRVTNRLRQAQKTRRKPNPQVARLI